MNDEEPNIQFKEVNNFENIGNEVNQNKCMKICKKRSIIIGIFIGLVIIIAFILIIAFTSSNEEKEYKKSNTLKLVYYTSEEEEVGVTLFSS